jgi:hypothetical protein
MYILFNTYAWLQGVNGRNEINGSLTDEGLRAIYKYCKCLEELDFSMCKKLTLTTIIPLLQKPETAMLIRKLFVSTKKV